MSEETKDGAGSDEQTEETSAPEVENAPEVEQETMDGDARKPFNRANVREVRNYTDGEGREVTELVSVFGKSPDANIYRGITTIVIKATQRGVPMPPQKRSFNFAIDATTVRSAFVKFDATADRSIEIWQKEQMERRRIMPAHGIPPVLLGVDGKPIG